MCICCGWKNTVLVHLQHITLPYNGNVVCGMWLFFIFLKKGITVVTNYTCIQCFNCHLFVKLFCEFVNIFITMATKGHYILFSVEGVVGLFCNYLLPVQINKCTKESLLFSSWLWNNAVLFLFGGLWLVSNNEACLICQHGITHLIFFFQSTYNNFSNLSSISFQGPKHTNLAMIIISVEPYTFLVP